MQKYRNQFSIISIITYTFLILIAGFTLAPFVFMLLSSFRPGNLMVQNGLTIDLNIKTMTLNNFKALLDYSEGLYFLWFKNSFFITVLQTVFSLILCSMVGYGLAMYDFKGRTLVFTIVLVVMMIPIEILILPLFKLSISLHIIDTYAGVILPFVVSPFAVFFFRQYILGIPKDLVDAGRIDGCSEFRIFFQIIIPVILPAFGAIGILQAMGSWNAFVWPLIVLRTNDAICQHR